jgi:hypothetical protein
MKINLFEIAVFDVDFTAYFMSKGEGEGLTSSPSTYAFIHDK